MLAVKVRHLNVDLDTMELVSHARLMSKNTE